MGTLVRRQRPPPAPRAPRWPKRAGGDDLLCAPARQPQREADGQDVLGLSWLAPHRSILRPSQHHDRQPQRDALQRPLLSISHQFGVPDLNGWATAVVSYAAGAKDLARSMSSSKRLMSSSPRSSPLWTSMKTSSPPSPLPLAMRRFEPKGLMTQPPASMLNSRSSSVTAAAPRTTVCSARRGGSGAGS